MFLQVDIRCATWGAHAETAIKSHERERLEKLVRYMARPAISDERVIIEGPQSIRVRLKSRWADGSESLLFTPIEFLERLVALILNKMPMLPFQFYQWQLPRTKNKNRTKENASRGHSFSNAHSKSMFSSVTNAADA